MQKHNNMKEVINNMIEVKAEINQLLTGDKQIGFTFARNVSPKLYFVRRIDGKVMEIIGTYKTGRELLIATISILRTLKYSNKDF